MHLTDKQLQRFTDHILELEAIRWEYKEQQDEESFLSITHCIHGMLYAADFLCLQLPLERKEKRLRHKSDTTLEEV